MVRTVMYSRKMMGRWVDREAVVVDARFNGGGDLVADLAMFFTGVKFNTYATADRDVGGEPSLPLDQAYHFAVQRSQVLRRATCCAEMYPVSLASGYCGYAGSREHGSFAAWAGLPDGTRWGVVPVGVPRNKPDQWMEKPARPSRIFVLRTCRGVMMPGVVTSSWSVPSRRMLAHKLDAE